MILLDLSGYLYGSTQRFPDEFEGRTHKEQKQALTKIVLADILNIKQKFSQEYGELIICCDYKPYWRKESFPQYKASRDATKDKSKLDWDILGPVFREFREDLKENFLWKVLRVSLAEADDIFGVLVKWALVNYVTDTGLDIIQKPVLLVSTDGDNIQLTKNSNVRQWSPKTKKYIDRLSKEDMRQFKIEHIVKGDTGDGIPNIFMPADFFVSKEPGQRQKTVTKSLLELFYKDKDTIRTELEAKFDEDQIKLIRERYLQNRLLTDYNCIPEHITNSIIDAHVNYTHTGSRDKIREYLVKNRCAILLSDLQNF